MLLDVLTFQFFHLLPSLGIPISSLLFLYFLVVLLIPRYLRIIILHHLPISSHFLLQSLLHRFLEHLSVNILPIELPLGSFHNPQNDLEVELFFHSVSTSEPSFLFSSNITYRATTTVLLSGFYSRYPLSA